MLYNTIDAFRIYLGIFWPLYHDSTSETGYIPIGSIFFEHSCIVKMVFVETDPVWQQQRADLIDNRSIGILIPHGLSFEQKIFPGHAI